MSTIADYLSFRFRVDYPEVTVRGVTDVIPAARSYTVDQLLEIAEEVLAAEDRRTRPGPRRPPAIQRPLPHLSPGQTWVLTTGAWRTITSTTDDLVCYYDENHEDYYTTMESFRRWVLRS